ncbi:hypothetical protein TrRE_jg246 [Triparma retinervis]|uniref:Peptidase M16 N-terminal domain-containing protein n=1 Tax=Triparma retinervis TaxID=2557542 RepID=A0A9W6ZXX6_9STRA|nr:hypothetical protein TrRE_jg246 [Triparma retinervis]
MADDEEAPNPELAMSAENAKLACEVAVQLSDEEVTASLSNLKVTIEEGQGRVKRAGERLTKLRSESSSASIYLQQKIADNFVTIERLEKEISEEQEARRESEFALINEVVGNKEKFSLRLESLRHELDEKTQDLAVILEFSEGQKETKERLERMRVQLEQQREKHRLARLNLSRKLDAELEKIGRDWEDQLSSTRDSLLRMTDDSLDSSTRRVIMETEKISGEVVYQDKEAAKLGAATRAGERLRAQLRGQLKEAERLEQSGAKKAYMYTRIIRKLRAMNAQRREALEEKVGSGRGGEEERDRARARGEERLAELVGAHKDANAAQREYNRVAKEARDKIDVVRSCRSGVVETMLDALGEFYEDDDEGSVELGWRREEVEEEEERLERLKLHRGYTSDLLGEEDDDDAKTIQSQLLTTEASMIDSIVGSDPALRSIFGLLPEDDEVSYDGGGHDGRGGGADPEDHFTSIADLRPDRRTRYLRRLVAKVHGFQMSQGFRASAGPAGVEGAGLGEAGGGAGTASPEGEDVGDGTVSSLPPISNPSGTSNVLTSILGGDVPPMPSRFFAPVKVAATLKMTASTQTELDVGGKVAASHLARRGEEREGEKARRRLHRGVDSPGYSPGGIISRKIQPSNSVINMPPTTVTSGRKLPSHETTVTGVLPNGFSYVILPNASPPGRFEAHLQVFTGSANELQHQQGIAHLTEHVAYMGSTKRERLFGTGSQTNAYTDFHHTVFYASCPCDIPGGEGFENSVFGGGARGKNGMMPLALDALLEVMEARVEPSRLEKERQAVLSEMTMVNTIEYRVECQILSTLHRENRLAKRFPIGKEALIRSWDTDDVKEFHRTHYRPDNVLLYIVGDVDTDEVERVIEDKFGALDGGSYEGQIGPEEKKEEAPSGMSAMSWHYPPVVHQWGESNSIRPHIFRHELLRSFSLHLFAKRAVKPIVTIEDFKRSLSKRIVLAALQIRLNVNARGDDAPFTFVEFNQLDSPREGCSVCSLDLMAESSRWREAVVMSVSEIRRLGKYGLTEGEMMRYAGALLSDSQQVAAQGDRIAHGDQLSYLMETVACGHALMSPGQSYEMTGKALEEMTLGDVNEAARELCEHVLSLGEVEGVDIDGPVIAVACGTKDEGMEGDVPCNERNLVEAILEAGNLEVKPEEDIVVPRTLVEEEELRGFMKEQNPTWEGGRFTDGTPPTDSDKITTPITLRRLSNGIRVGVTSTDTESQRGHLRIVAPGGRVAEER